MATWAEFQAVRALLSHRDLFQVDASLAAAVVSAACVRTVGLTEVSIRSTVGVYCEKRGTRSISRYVTTQLKQFYNPNEKKIRELLGSFSAEWAEEFSVFATEEVKDALDSLVNNKNKIAHGDPTTLSIGTIRPWLGHAESTCRFIDELLAR